VALLWSYREDGSLYQVRAAGSSRRLYTDGVLHTQYNPRRIVTGSVWDLLWLPLFFRAAPRIGRVLVLGVGAGAVIRQLDALFRPQKIVGVEKNAVHLRVAREFFGVTPQMATLHLSDATEFVHRYRGVKFDLVIDDLFCGNRGIPSRAVSCDHHWMKQLVRHLVDEGTLCVNFADWREFREAPFSRWFGSDQRFRSAFELRAPETENVVAALLPWRVEPASLRAHLRGTPALAGALRAGQLRYRVRTITSGRR